MENGLQNQELVPENLRKQLAAAVRSIQWSYGIFWSTSPTQPGVLKWCEGYYNGDIKTRKTVQAVELNDDLIGLQRSQQLRELYVTLLAGESNLQSRRPSAALSPEDLTNTEWYYLVCMNFDFSLGQGLPGRAFLNEGPIWLCNAQNADSKVFSRLLLAKSASIQTVVCFPFLGGVVELGVTELVSEDLSLIQRVKASLFAISRTIHSQKGTNSFSYLDFVSVGTMVTPLTVGKVKSPRNSCDEFRLVEGVDEEAMIDGIDGEASQAQSWCFMDDELSNCIYSSMTSSDCISQSFFSPDNILSTQKDENWNDVADRETSMLNLELQQGEDLHYQKVLSSLLKTSHSLVLRPFVRHTKKQCSFISWRKQCSEAVQNPWDRTRQRMLKKVLFEVRRYHDHSLLELDEREETEDKVWGLDMDETNTNHVGVERRRRGTVNERFSALKTLIPSTSQADKVTVLDDAIALLKQLKRKVELLESCQDVSDHAAGAMRKPQDLAERTSDNYHKRKASDRDVERMQETNHVEDPCKHISISMFEKEIMIELKFPWRECLLIEIMDTLSNLHLDSYSVQSSSVNGILSLTAKAKIRGSSGASAGMIRKELQRVLHKC